MGEEESMLSLWKTNIKKNLKVISAILGDVLVSIFTVLLYAWNSGLTLSATLFILVMSMKPFIILYINIITKGETRAQEEIAKEAQEQMAKAIAEKDKQLALLEQRIGFLEDKETMIRENKQLKKQLEYERDLSEYKAQLAARDGKVINGLKATKDWKEANNGIEKLEESE